MSEIQKTYAIFGGGCFWCTEAVFQRLKGVMSVVSGYAGGDKEKPSYEAVSSGNTGHAEVIRVEFDPSIIKYEDLLNVFFTTHDPTTLNQQGADKGTQYRSVVFYSDDVQHQAVTKFISELEKEKVFNGPIVTEVKPIGIFFPAENYHQNFYNNNQNYPYCQAVINPKLAKLRQKFAALLKD